MASAVAPAVIMAGRSPPAWMDLPPLPKLAGPLAGDMFAGEALPVKAFPDDAAPVIGTAGFPDAAWAEAAAGIAAAAGMEAAAGIYCGGVVRVNVTGASVRGSRTDSADVAAPGNGAGARKGAPDDGAVARKGAPVDAAGVSSVALAADFPAVAASGFKLVFFSSSPLTSVAPVFLVSAEPLAFALDVGAGWG